MFKKVLIANRGEIAVRVIRTCRDLGITTVTVYDTIDRGALHVRLADECWPLTSSEGYLDQAVILQIAKAAGVDAIHPGYGFLAERDDFIAACEQAGIKFVGPSSQVMSLLGYKVDALHKARAAGIPTPVCSTRGFNEGEYELLKAEADTLGYPLVIKSCHGGRGRGERLVRSPHHLAETVRRAQAETYSVYGNKDVYLERAITGAHQIDVQIIRDAFGNFIHLGEREGSIQRGNQKIIEETPAPSVNQAQREQLWRMAAEVAALFDYHGVGTVEFLMDHAGAFFFTEIKARIQVEHPISEMVSRVDLIHEQLRVAQGEPLALRQSDVELRGWAIHCRISAEDPWNNYLPTPGQLDHLRLPGGPNVRVDTHIFSGYQVPAQYDPLLAKLSVWGVDRAECVQRTRRVLQELSLSGIQTTLPLLQRILDDPDFIRGEYDTQFYRHALLETNGSDIDRRDLAIAAALAYTNRTRLPITRPARVLSGWHQDSRRLPG